MDFPRPKWKAASSPAVHNEQTEPGPQPPGIRPSTFGDRPHRDSERPKVSPAAVETAERPEIEPLISPKIGTPKRSTVAAEGKKTGVAKLLLGAAAVFLVLGLGWAVLRQDSAPLPRPPSASAELLAWQNKIGTARTYDELTGLLRDLDQTTTLATSKQELGDQLRRKQSSLEDSLKQSARTAKSSVELDKLLNGFASIPKDSPLEGFVQERRKAFALPAEAEKSAMAGVKTLLDNGSLDEAKARLTAYAGPKSAMAEWEDLDARMTAALANWNGLKTSTIVPALEALQKAAGDGDVESAASARKTIEAHLPAYGRLITRLPEARKMAAGETPGWLDAQIAQAEQSKGTRLFNTLLTKGKKAMETGRLSEVDDVVAQLTSRSGNNDALTAPQRQEIAELSAFHPKITAILGELTGSHPLNPVLAKQIEAITAPDPKKWLSWAAQTRELIQLGDYMGALQSFATNPLPKDPVELPDQAWQKLSAGLDGIVTKALGPDLKAKGQEYTVPSEYAPQGTRASTLPDVVLKVQQALAGHAKLATVDKISAINADGHWGRSTQNAVLHAQHVLLPSSRQADGRLNDDLLDALGVRVPPAVSVLGKAIARATAAIEEGRLSEAESTLAETSGSSILASATAEEKESIAQLKDLSAEIRNIVQTLEKRGSAGPEILGRIRKIKGAAAPQAWLQWAGQTRQLIDSGDYMAALKVFNGKDLLEAGGRGTADPVWKNLAAATDASVKEAVGPYLKKFGKEFDDPAEYAPKGTRASEIDNVIGKVQKAIASHPRLKDVAVGDVKLAELSLKGEWGVQMQNAVIRAQHILLPNTQADGRLNDDLISSLRIDAPPPTVDPANLAELFATSPYSGYSEGGQSNILGLAQQKMKGLTPDGGFGPKTLQGIKDYQAQNSLAITGRLDNETLKAMGLTGLADKPKKVIAHSDSSPRKRAADSEPGRSRPPSSSDNGINPKMDPYSGYLRQNSTIADTVARLLNKKGNKAVKQMFGRDVPEEQAEPAKKKTK